MLKKSTFVSVPSRGVRYLNKLNFNNGDKVDSFRPLTGSKVSEPYVTNYIGYGGNMFPSPHGE